MRSIDEKILFGSIDDLKKIKNITASHFKEIDVNQLEIETKISLDLEVFFSVAMRRLVAKIAFEWYCARNEINIKKDEFSPIINFIAENKGENIVSIVSNPNVYELFNYNLKRGSHALFSYISNDKSINVIVNLFGIALYNVRLCDLKFDDCKFNAMFQELTLDAKHFNFKYKDFRSLKEHFCDSFEQIDLGLGFNTIFPKDLTDTTLRYKLMYITNYQIFRKGLNLVIEPNHIIIDLILENIQNLLHESDVSIRGLKRFVREHQKHFNEGFRLNQNGTDKKSIFMYYILFIIGRSNEQVTNMQELNRMLQSKFATDSIHLTEGMINDIHDELLEHDSNIEMIIKGANIVEGFLFE